MLRKVRDAADARGCLRSAEAAGQQRAAWARDNGVDPRSLNAWRINLAREPRCAPGVRLVELVTQEVPTARYVIRCGDLAIEVDDRFHSETLRRLLGVVSAC